MPKGVYIRKKVDTRKRFDSFVMPEPNSGCHLWLGGLSGGNSRSEAYGGFWLDGKATLAHRQAYVWEHGEIPDGLVICHRCDNSLCVNPEHLFVGTYSDNVQDMLTKRRGNPRRGDTHPCAKLTTEEVDFVRVTKMENSTLARVLGVNPSTISRIRSGERRVQPMITRS